MSIHTPGPWLVLICAVILAGCDAMNSMNTGQNKSAGAESHPGMTGAIMATVNGRPIHESLYEAYLQQRSQRRPMSGSAEELQAALNELIDMEVVLQDAEKNGLDTRPDIAARLELQRRSLLVREDVREYTRSTPVSEEEQRAFYEQQIVANSGKEYRARHILLESEEDANDIIAQLDGGADFAKLAEEHSTGPSAKQGGNLGWFPPARMVAPFSEAVAEMEKGSYTKTPVQTQFGWHVILLEDVRDTTPPTFEEAQNRIAGRLRAQRLEQYVNQLRNAAEIKVNATPAPISPPTTIPSTEPAPDQATE